MAHEAKYGIRAYGRDHMFTNKKAFTRFLIDWISGTEGSEQERASLALGRLYRGIPFTDSDRGER